MEFKLKVIWEGVAAGREAIGTLPFNLFVKTDF